MPRYFFHSEDGGAYFDPEGAELPDFDAARLEATRYLAELLLEQAQDFWKAGKLQVMVADAGGALLCVLTLTGAEAPGRRPP